MPSSYKIGTSVQNTTETVHRNGEINILGDRNLETIEISSFFPAQEYPFCQYKGFDTNPINYINKIKKWEYEKVTPTFVMTGDVDFNKTVSIESLEYGKDDSTGDIAFTLNLKEYIAVSYSAAKKKTSNGKKVKKKNSSKKRSSKSVKITSYTVKKGDTLRKIAKKKTGSSSNWKKIYTKNKKVIESAAKKHKRRSSSNGRYIYAGTKLVIEK